MDIYEEIIRLRRAGIKAALATIVNVRGSIPSYESAKLLVREDGSLVGTVGGGCAAPDLIVSMSFSWLFLGGLLSSRARLRFTNWRSA